MRTAGSYAVVYRGSVKNVRCVKPPRGRSEGLYVFEFTDDYSVFDYGKMPDTIRGKGSALAGMTAFLFEELENPAAWKQIAKRRDLWERFDRDGRVGRVFRSQAGRQALSAGLRTHYVGLLDRQGKPRRLSELREPSNRILVRAVPVLTPTPVSVHGRTVWDYRVFQAGVPQYLIPLEIVFRFGLPKGSSLLDRIRENPAYGQEVGLDALPEEGRWLQRPVIEFSTKLEPSDRYLSLESAFQFSGLDGAQFSELVDRALLVALFLFGLFRDRGLDLWDGKFEFVKSRSGLLLADTITPDELRILCGPTQISKEPLRQYYKKQDREFLGAIQEAKKEGASSRSMRTRILQRLGRPPRQLDPGFRRTVEQMYQAITYRVTGCDLFRPPVDLEDVLAALEQDENV